MRRAAIALMAVMLAGCSARSGSAATAGVDQPSAAASPSSQATPTVRPSPPTTLASASGGQPSPLRTALVSTPGCPSESPLTVADVADGEPICFGPVDVEVRGFVAPIVGIGMGPPGIAPGWLWVPDSSFVLWNRPPGPEQDCEGVDPCGWMFVHVPPDAGVAFAGPERAVIVTGHTLDPAATTCHYVFEGQTFSPEEDREAQESCERAFVMTAIRDAP